MEDSALRQESLRRETLRYEAELRSKTETKRAEVEIQLQAQSERENHDLSMQRLQAEMKEQRETILQSISVGFSSLGDGATAFLGDQQQMRNAVVLVSGLAIGVYSARASVSVFGNYVANLLGKPTLVRETSRMTPLKLMVEPIKSISRAFRSTAGDSLNRVILNEELEVRLRQIAISTKYTKINDAHFRHVLLHGPPGTGKTMFAKQLAMYSGLDYAILTGGDVAPLGRDAVTEIHKLFDWARYSRKGLLLFIDEADAFLRKRATETMSEDLRNAFNAFLYRGLPARYLETCF